jgi:hypothetical protein
MLGIIATSPFHRDILPDVDVPAPSELPFRFGRILAIARSMIGGDNEAEVCAQFVCTQLARLFDERDLTRYMFSSGREQLAMIVAGIRSMRPAISPPTVVRSTVRFLQMCVEVNLASFVPATIIFEDTHIGQTMSIGIRNAYLAKLCRLSSVGAMVGYEWHVQGRTLEQMIESHYYPVLLTALGIWMAQIRLTEDDNALNVTVNRAIDIADMFVNIVFEDCRYTGIVHCGRVLGAVVGDMMEWLRHVTENMTDDMKAAGLMGIDEFRKLERRLNVLLELFDM